uniref:Uncharacterized protein n=1 Tax=Thermogemmatispora argillosa TaxID=2045280 RepID=A0A455SYG6_9CHLR|nr:hypothetical protein KTA_04000 [Thermogemmatispora argillosa]
MLHCWQPLGGPTGQVWIVVLEEELAHQGQVLLQAAGFGERVQVIATDGWQGHAPAAPMSTSSLPPVPPGCPVDGMTSSPLEDGGR